MQPNVMRSLGGVAPPAPSADAGTMVGKPTATPVSDPFRNSRLLLFRYDGVVDLLALRVEASRGDRSGLPVARDNDSSSCYDFAGLFVFYFITQEYRKHGLTVEA